MTEPQAHEHEMATATKQDPRIVEKLRDLLQEFMEIESIKVVPGENPPLVEIVGRMRAEVTDDLFDALLERLKPLGYTPALSEQEGMHVVQLIPEVIEPGPVKYWINAFLFGLTTLSVFYTGVMMENSAIISTLDDVWRGLPFTLAVLGILLVHEFSHYFTGRRYGSPVSLPYFIPLPFLSPIGTMGALIVQKGPMRSRKSLFDIGIAGPLGGLIVAVPLLLWGLSQSYVGTPADFGLVPEEGTPLIVSQEGSSLVYLGAKYLLHGEILPSADGRDVWLSPPSPGGSVTFAAWVGLLITSLNLFPIGQLDGGHVAYAMWGRRAWALARAVIGISFAWALFLLLSGNLAGVTWLVWMGLGRLMGPNHPPPLNDVTPLDATRRRLGWVVVLIFFLILVPIPFVTVALQGG